MLFCLQANPLNHKQPDIHNLTGSRGMLAAKKALVVPMLLRLSHFRLSSYVVLVVSKQKGITLVFKTDPLQNVDINSTFDSIAVIQSFIQREIEGQLRQMFREDLPGIIHRLSQQWFKAKVEAPYLHQQRPPPPPPTPAAVPLPPSSIGSFPPARRPRPQGSYAASVSSVPTLPPYPYPLRPRAPSSISYAPSRVSSPSLRRQPLPTPLPPPDAPESSHPDIENFDPTYGLRPGSLPAKSVFGAFGRLFNNSARGLADLAEEPADEDEGDVDGADGQSYGMVEWEDTLPDYEYDYSRDPSELGPDDLEYETLPAVGGGTITRPRVFHAQSQVHAPDGVSLTPVSRAPPNYPYTPQNASMSMSMGISRMTPAALARLQMPPGAYNPYFPPMGVTPPTFSPGLGLASRDPRIPLGMPSVPPTPPLYHSPPRRARSPAPSNSQTQPSASSSQAHSLPTPPSSERPVRSRAGSSSWYPEPDDEPWPRSPGTDAGDRKIVLRPGALPRLATLAHSNHTLSPYTRVPEHFAVRTGAPAKAAAAGTPVSAPVRARRKRIHKLGGKGKEKAVDAPGGGGGEVDMGSVDSLRRTGSTSPAPPSEMADDLDRYFLRAGELPPSVQAEVDARMAINANPWPPDAYAGLRMRGVHATSIRSGRSGRL